MRCVKGLSGSRTAPTGVRRNVGPPWKRLASTTVLDITAGSHRITQVYSGFRVALVEDRTVTARTRARQWLALGEASESLGVHPSTLRVWADAGDVRSFRTPGGHRRFRASEIEALVGKAVGRGAPQAVDGLARQLVVQTRHDLLSLQDGSQAWLAVFPNDQREGWRESGRRLAGLAIQYVSRRQGREGVIAEARAIGARYARECLAHRLSLSNTVRAYLFFRESLLKATRPGLVARGQYDEEDARIHREMREFLDEVLYAMLDTLETACR